MQCNRYEYDLPDYDLFINPKDGFQYMIWRPIEDSIVLGQSNQPDTALYLEAVQRDDIPIWKRPSGGETVYLSPNTVVVSLSLQGTPLQGSKYYFRRFNQEIQGCLSELGVSSLGYKGISDLAIGEKKILGCALYRKPDYIFYHAVLNVAEDIHKIATYLRHPSREPDYRQGRDHTEFVTSIQETNPTLSVEQIAIKLQEHFEKLSTTWQDVNRV